jgi:CHAT domain-containing protein/tetratricopeptide (TPR) repeat protein
VTIILFATIFASPAFARGEADADSTEALLKRIGELRREAKYAEAVVEAEKLLQLKKSDSATKAYEIVNAEVLLETLTLIAGMDKAAQEELAEADQLTPQIKEHFEAADYVEAANLAQKQLEIRERHLGDEHADVATSKAQLSLQLHRQRYYERAEPLCREALETRRKILGEDHPDFIGSEYNLANLLTAQGNYEEAEQLHLEVIAARRAFYGDDHHAIMASLNALGTLFRVEGKYEESQASYRDGLAMAKRLYGEEHQYVSNFIMNLAIVYHVQGDYDNAEPLYREAIEMYTNTLGYDHPMVGMALSNLGILLRAKGDYENAELICRQMVERERQRLGDEHPIVALNISNLANVLSEKGDYRGAEELAREALEMRRKLLGNEHKDVAASCINVANTLKNQGRYDEAEPLFREALAINRKLYGDEHVEIALNLNNLAGLLRAKGDYDAAEPLYREALAMRRRILGEEDLNVAQSLNNLGNLLKVKGDFDGAEQLYREGLAMRRRIFGEEHWRVAESINNVAVALECKGNYAAAEPLFDEALAMRRATLGDDHPLVAESLNNVALVLRAQGEYDRSVEVYREALELYRTTLGDEHPDVAMCLNNLGVVLGSKGDYDEAESLLVDAVEMRRRLLGDQHPDVAESFYNLAEISLARGDYEEAESLLLQASQVYDAARLRAGSGLATITFLTSPYPALAITELELGKMQEAWAAAERDLGRVLADLLITAEQRRLTDAEAAREDSLKGALGDLERELVAYQEASEEDTTGKITEQMQDAHNRLLAAEADWSAFQHEMTLKYPIVEGQAYSLDRVQDALPDRAAIIGWLDVQGKDGKFISWGYVILNSGPVFWELLESSDRADAISPLESSRLLRDGLTSHSIAALGIKQSTRNMWSTRVAPFSEKLKDVKHLIVIPSGAMLGIPIEALEDDEGVCVGERFNVTYIPSATMYTWLSEMPEKRGRKRNDQALLVGDPPFTESHLASMEKEAEAEASGAASIDTIPDVAMLRSALAGNDKAIAALPRLPATRAEVMTISSISRNPTLLVGPEASEQELVQLAETGALREYVSMHFATHALMDDEYPERSALVLSQVGLPDPLEAVMAGKRIYDGLATSKEIVMEWELDADLVTLSACETGLGKKVGGEGYIGLSHAFFQAGARSVLVSLWKVEDQATSMLMKRFYENYFGKYKGKRNGKRKRAMPKAEALREAKYWLKTFTDESGQKPYEHPYFWSSFILMGRGD